MSVKFKRLPATKHKPAGWMVLIDHLGQRVNKTFRGVPKEEVEAMVPGMLRDCEDKDEAERLKSHFGVVKKLNPTYADACDLYETEKNADGKKLIAGFQRSREQLGHIRLSEMNAVAIRNWAEGIYPDKPQSQNRQCISVVSAVYNRAADEDWCQHKKFKKVKVPKNKMRERTAVSAEYVEQLALAMLNLGNKYDGAFELLAVGSMTGMRMSELVQMQWSLTDLESTPPQTTIPKTKTTDEVTVSLSQHLATMLKQMRLRQAFILSLNLGDPERPHHHTRARLANDRVFGWEDSTSTYPVFKEAAKAAGLPYVSPHQVMRHSFATRLAEMDWSSTKIVQTGRWAAGSEALVEGTYTHVDDRTVEAAEAIEKVVSFDPSALRRKYTA